MIDIFQIVRLNELDNYYSVIDKFDINIVNEHSENLLHEAVAGNHIEITVDLISRGINVNQQGEKGMTPLQYAISNNRIELARAIIDAGGNINIRDNYGNNAL